VGRSARRSAARRASVVILLISGFAGDFVYDVSARLPAGGYAVVASVWEDWTVPVDVAMTPFGGVVFRQATDDVVVSQIRADMQALNEEQQHLEAEIAKSIGEAKARLEAKRTEIRAKQAAQRDKLRTRAARLLASSAGTFEASQSSLCFTSFFCGAHELWPSLQRFGAMNVTLSLPMYFAKSAAA